MILFLLLKMLNDLGLCRCSKPFSSGAEQNTSYHNMYTLSQNCHKINISFMYVPTGLHLRFGDIIGPPCSLVLSLLDSILSGASPVPHLSALSKVFFFNLGLKICRKMASGCSSFVDSCSSPSSDPCSDASSIRDT